MSAPISDDCLQLAYAYGEPAATARLRVQPEDFFVEEILPFEPSGDGEHVWLYLEKRERNTADVAQALARQAGVSSADIGYSGLKDRRAVARQWFSLCLHRDVDMPWHALAGPDVRVLAVTRHTRKLRRGTHSANRFVLRLREVKADAGALAECIARVRLHGVPNYFGEQRFGRDCANLRGAVALLSGAYRERNRHKRGLYLSAARAHVFNQVLCQRVEAGTWAQALVGDVMVLSGRHGFFTVAEIDDDTRARVAGGEITPSGPLWGRGGPAIGPVERDCLAGLHWWTEHLEGYGMKHERRALRLSVTELSAQWDDDTTLRLSFVLPRGGFATAALRELVRTASQP